MSIQANTTNNKIKDRVVFVVLFFFIFMKIYYKVFYFLILPCGVHSINPALVCTQITAFS